MDIRVIHEALMQQTKGSVNRVLAQAVAAHHGTLLVAGNIYDFTINQNKLIYVPQLLMQQLKAAGYCVIQYSKGRGGRIYQYSSYNSSPEKKNIDQRLRAVGLLPMLTQDQAQPADGEVTSFFRSMGRLLQVATPSGPPLALVLEYAEHQCPHEQGNQSESDENLVVAEILHSLANSPALRRSGNLVICFARNEYHSLLNDFHRIDYAFPSQAQTETLINFVKEERRTQRTIYADLATGFSNGELAKLTQGMGLKDIESMFRDAHAKDQDLRRNAILEAKAASILRASEGTLSLVRTRDVSSFNDIIGLDVAKAFFKQVAEKLKAGERTSPRAILLAGPPGTAKTTFPPLLADLAGFNIIRFENVKNKFIGESERRLRLALSLAESLAPVILMIDEITEALPDRSTQAADGGVSQDLLAQLYDFSSRDDLRGRVLLLACTNLPGKLDVAWHDRFQIIPFLELVPDDMVKLFPLYDKRLNGKTSLKPDDELLVEASLILHQRGASPRKVLDIVNHALLFSNTQELCSRDILTAANDYRGSASPERVAFTSLSAVALTSWQSILPWSHKPKDYKYPWYLKDLVDRETGEVDKQKLKTKLEEYRRYLN